LLLLLLLLGLCPWLKHLNVKKEVKIVYEDVKGFYKVRVFLREKKKEKKREKVGGGVKGNG
jgi:hypothetical protein